MGEHRFIAAAIVVACAAAPRAARADDQPLSYGDNGLRLGTTSLFADPVDAAALDAAQDLVWFRSKNQLEVIDLREASPAAVVIAKNLPADSAFAIAGSSNASYFTEGWVLSYPRFRVGKSVKVEAVKARDPGDNHQGDADVRKAIKKIKIVGTKWLKALAKRTPHDVVAVKTGKESQAAQWCASNGVDDACGTSRAIGTSGFEVVQIGAGPDGSPTCALWDSSSAGMTALDGSAQWNDGDTGMEPCVLVGPEPGGTRYYDMDQICTPGKKVVCEAADGWRYFGWFAGDAGTTTAVSGPGTAAQALVELGAFETEACKCHDDKCRKDIIDRLTAFASKYADTKGSDAETKQATDVMQKISDCLSK